MCLNLKEIIVIIAIIILSLIAFATLIPFIIMGLGIALIVYSIYAFKRSHGFWKLLWIVLGILGVSIVFHALPEVFIIVAIIALVMLLLKWRRARRYDY